MNARERVEGEREFGREANRSNRAVEEGEVLESGEGFESSEGEGNVIRTVGEVEREEVAEGS